MQVQSYKELIVWQKSILLVKEIYKITGKLPRDEQFGLISQMRRSAVSTPSNIAEGYKRKGLGEYVQFLSIADGSAAELETQLIILESVYTGNDCHVARNLLEEVQKMLLAMIKKLKLIPPSYTLHPKR